MIRVQFCHPPMDVADPEVMAPMRDAAEALALGGVLEEREHPTPDTYSIVVHEVSEVLLEQRRLAASGVVDFKSALARIKELEASAAPVPPSSSPAAPEGR